MTMRITMTQTRMGEAGSLLNAGSTYTVSDAFGAQMVQYGFAADTDRSIPPDPSFGDPVGGLVVDAVSAAANNTQLIQAALNAGATVQVLAQGALYINDTLLLPNDTSLTLGAGVSLVLAAGTNRNMLKTSNVRMVSDGSAVALTGVQLLYADTATTAGIGTLTYTNSGTTLTWTAPGDTPGTPVNISAGGYFRLASGTAGRALYVMMATASGGRPGSDKTCSVYVSTLKGATICSGSVTSNVLTVTETAHGRGVRDVVEVYRPGTSASMVVEIASVPTSSTWTAAWTITNFTSEALAVHGVRNVAVYGPGVFDGNRDNQTNSSSTEKYPLYFRNASKVKLRDFTIKNAVRAASFYNPTDYVVSALNGDNVSVFLQFEGIGNRIDIRDIHSSSSASAPDDLLAFTQTNSTVDGTYTFNGSAVFGSMRNVNIAGVHSAANHLCAVKVAGYTGALFDAFSIRSIDGSGGNGAFQVVDDTAGLTGGLIGSFVASDVSWNVVSGSGTGEIFNFTMTGGATSINLVNCTFNGTNSQGIRINASSGTISNLLIDNPRMMNSPTVTFMSVNQTVTRLAINESDFVMGSGGKVLNLSAANANVASLALNGGSWTGNAGAYGVHHNDGIVTNVHFNGIYAATIRNLYESETTADNSPRIMVNGCYCQATATGMTFRVGATVDIADWGAGSLGNNLLQDNASVALTVNANGPINTTSSLFLGSGTSRTVKGLNFQQSPAFSATPTFRLSNGNIVSPGVMTANITSITLQDIPPAGQAGSFIFTQDGTGSRTIAAPSTWKFPTAAFVNSGLANTKTVLNWVSDGTNLIMQGTNAWN